MSEPLHIEKESDLIPYYPYVISSSNVDNKTRVKEHSKFTTEQLKRLFDSRKADYEVKIIVQLNLSERDVQFINGRIVEAAKRFGMCLQEDGITYSKKAPYKRFEDIIAGFKFYNTLRKYEEYFSVFEYYSYLEGDYNGVICRGFDSNQLHVL